MKSFRAIAIFLALGFVATGASAEDTQWHAAASPSTPAVNTSARNNSSSQAATSSAPIVTLSRPVPIRSTAKARNDSAIKPVSFEAAPITRTKADEVRSPDQVTPLPFGPTSTPVPESPATEVIPVKPNPVTTSRTAGSLSGPAAPYGDPSGSCDDCCSAFSGCCPPRGRIWFSGEYLLWATRAANAPPLLTTATPGTPRLDAGGNPLAGTLGQPTTFDLWDKNQLPGEGRNGGRFTLGFWLPCRDDIGLETSYFFLGQRNNDFFVASDGSPGSPILTRPFFDATRGNASSAIPTAYPGFIGGSFGVNSNSYLWGIEANVRKKLLCGCCGYLDLLVGYRYFQLQDGIDMFDMEQPLAPPGQPPFFVNESFFTRNQFNGGQIGLDGQWNFWRRWFIGATVKVALGNVHQTININGNTTGAAAAPFGVLALPSNIGAFSRDRFGVLPASTLKLGYTFNDHWRAWVGYDFLYLNSVVRAGDQIDLALNHNLLPGGSGLGPVRPAVPFTATGFWAQGASFGLEYRW
jgi:hypothetical protein